MVVIAGLGCALVGWGYAAFVRPGPLTEPRTTIIPRGSGVDAIAGLLSSAGVISHPLAFLAGARLTGAGKGLRYGEYAFEPGISMQDVLAKLLSGKTVVRRLTVPEGLTGAQIMQQFLSLDGLEGSIERRPDEGALLPDTYHYSYGDSRQSILQRMSESMEAHLQQKWRERPPSLLKSPREALILASIVEKETGIAAERPHVAAVFLNRLKRGMRLQSDPTVVYGLTRGSGALGRALARADLQSDSPFNTYVMQGLPPGPICNPGRASVDAVLFPANTSDLYFVADGAGGHVFAETLEEHNRNVARWRKLRPEP